MDGERASTAPCPSCGAAVTVEITTTGPVQHGTFKCDCGEEFEFELEFLGEVALGEDDGLRGYPSARSDL